MTVRCRVYPAPTQAEQMREHCTDARFVWNLCVEQHRMWRRGRGPTPSHAERNRQLTQARSLGCLPGTRDLSAGSVTVQQQALRDFDKAVSGFYKGTCGRPNFRRRGVHESFNVTALKTRQLNRKWLEVQVPKVGWVRVKYSKRIPAEAKSVRIKLMPTGKWYATFPSASGQPDFEKQPTGKTVGIDRGVALPVAMSDGTSVQRQSWLTPGEQKRKLRLERNVARSQKGSRNRLKARRRLAVLREREVSRRKDWVEKLTTELVRENDVIVLEDLQIKNMTKKGRGKRGLNREILAAAWGQLSKRLEDKAGAATTPTFVIKINPAYTSQTCSNCQNRAPENRESQAIFRCKTCDFACNADVNAANVILQRGLVELELLANSDPEVGQTLAACGDLSSYEVYEPGTTALPAEKQLVSGIPEL